MLLLLLLLIAASCTRCQYEQGSDYNVPNEDLLQEEMFSELDPSTVSSCISSNIHCPNSA